MISFRLLAVFSFMLDILGCAQKAEVRAAAVAPPVEGSQPDIAVAPIPANVALAFSVEENLARQ